MKHYLILVICLVPMGLPAAWYSNCPACEAHLGGTSHGPFDTQSACEQARQQELNQNFPFVPCTSDGSGSSSSAGVGGSLQQDTAEALTKGIVNNNAQEFGVGLAGLGAMAVINGLSQPSGPDPEQIRQQQILAEQQRQRELAAQQLNNSGLYLLRQNDYDGAINEFTRALAQTPNDPAIQANLDQARKAKFTPTSRTPSVS